MVRLSIVVCLVSRLMAVDAELNFIVLLGSSLASSDSRETDSSSSFRSSTSCSSAYEHVINYYATALYEVFFIGLPLLKDSATESLLPEMVLKR